MLNCAIVLWHPTWQLTITSNHKLKTNYLEKKLSENDLNLEDPNFVEPKEEIKISHIKEHEIKSRLTTLLKSYDSVFSRSKFEVGSCSLINTKIPLINDTSKHIEPERKLKPEEFHQVEALINE